MRFRTLKVMGKAIMRAGGMKGSFVTKVGALMNKRVANCARVLGRTERVTAGHVMSRTGRVGTSTIVNIGCNSSRMVSKTTRIVTCKATIGCGWVAQYQ